MNPGEVWQWIEDESVIFLVLAPGYIVYLSYDGNDRDLGRVMTFDTSHGGDHRRIA